MINLCNTTSYSNDKQGQKLTKRVPRANEDIEIIGDIDQDTTIDLSQLNSLCGLSKISSLTIPFKTDRVYSLSIVGAGGILDASNARAPTGTDLENITRINPLRVQHGWYTMATGYGIGTLTTNSTITLTNIALENSVINATDIFLNTSAYSNGILNVNNVSLQNTSYLYGTTIECSGITLNGGSKCDTLNITSDLLTLNDSSIAESQFFGSGIFSSGSSIIDCEIECENLQIIDGHFQSRFDYGGSSSNPDIRFTNSVIYSNSQINSKYLSLNNTQISGGTIKADSIEFLQGTTINRDAVVDAEVISLSVLTNEGILNFNSFSGLTTPIIVNNGNININNTIAINIVITNNGKLQLNASGNFISGINNKTINGTNTILQGSFINNVSGIILSPVIKFCNSSVNNGRVDTSDVTFIDNSHNAGFFNKATFLGSSFNIGSGNTAIFSGQNSTNNGSIITGKFFLSNNNGEVIDLTIYSGINTGRGDSITLYSSTHNGQYPNFDAYGASVYNTSYPVKNGSFYDTSVCNLIVGSGGSGEINFYNSAILNGSANNLTVHFFDNSSAQGTINKTGIFHDNSIFTEGNINDAIFQDMSRSEGNISRMATFIDNSTNNGNLGPGLSVATFNKAKNYGNIYGANVYFNEGAINFGTISTLGFTANDSINSGSISLIGESRSTLSNFINHGSLSGIFDFRNNSINYGTITGSGTFDATSVNSGAIIES